MSRFRFKKLLKESVISKFYMQLFVCTALVLSCFFVYSFVYLFINYSSKIFSLRVSQLRTQAKSCYPKYQRRLGTECDSTRRPRRIFETSLTGDVTSEITEDD